MKYSLIVLTKNTTFSSLHSSTGTTTQQHDESVVATIGS